MYSLLQKLTLPLTLNRFEGDKTEVLHVLAHIFGEAEQAKDVKDVLFLGTDNISNIDIKVSCVFGNVILDQPSR